MKNLKRTVAMFVSAVMVMAMLAGCGGGNSSSGGNLVDLGKMLRDATGTSQSDDLDKIANTLANSELTTQSVEVAVASYGEIYKPYGMSWTFIFEEENGTTAFVPTTKITENSERGDYIIIIQYESATPDEVLEFFSSFKVLEEPNNDNMVYIAAEATGAESGIIVVDFAIIEYSDSVFLSSLEGAYGVAALMSIITQ